LGPSETRTPGKGEWLSLHSVCWNWQEEELPLQSLSKLMLELGGMETSPGDPGSLLV